MKFKTQKRIEAEQCDLYLDLLAVKVGLDHVEEPNEDSILVQSIRLDLIKAINKHCKDYLKGWRVKL